MLEDTAKVGARADVVLWQELGERQDREALRSSLPASEWVHVHDDMRLPISFRRDTFRLLDSGKIKTHGGREGVSPQRWITWALVEPLAEGFAPFIIWNTHFVSGAWNDKRLRGKAWRREMWLVHFDRLKAFAELHAGNGVMLIGGGDFNRVDVPEFHPDLVWLWDRRSIDKLTAVPSGAVLVLGDSDRVGLNSDHPMYVRDVVLKGGN